MFGLFYPYGIVLQAIAIAHFARRRPDTYWLWIIIIGGGLGAAAYILLEVVPDAGLLRTSFQVFPRRRQIKQLQAAIIDNPSIGNYEELGDLYLEDGQFARARECFDKVIASRPDTPDPYYRRALAELALDDASAAVTDLEKVFERDPKYDYQRAAGLLAHALGKTGQPERGLAALRRYTRALDSLGNAVQLRRAPRRAGKESRGEGVGGARPAQEAHDAVLPAAPGAPVVQKSRRAIETPLRRTALDAKAAQPTSTQFSVRSTAFCHPRYVVWR